MGGICGTVRSRAVVDALVGETGMPGRLPVTLPAYAGAVPVRYNDRQSAEHVYRDAEEPLLRPFGFGEGSLSGVRVESFTATAADRTVRVDLRLHGGQEPARGTCIVFVRRIGGSRIPVWRSWSPLNIWTWLPASGWTCGWKCRSTG